MKQQENIRRYARRNPQAPRTAMLSFRLTPAVRSRIGLLAESLKVSRSEYLCRLLNDHLATAGSRFDPRTTP
jgi:hypothetical protein